MKITLDQKADSGVTEFKPGKFYKCVSCKHHSSVDGQVGKLAYAISTGIVWVDGDERCVVMGYIALDAYNFEEFQGTITIECP